MPVRTQQDQILVRKREETPLSTDSGIISPENQLLATPQTPDQPSTSHPRDTATPILTLTQRHLTPARLTNNQASSTKSPTPWQELRRAVARHIKRNPRYQRAQPNQPAQQSVRRERTRIGYKEKPYHAMPLSISKFALASSTRTSVLRRSQCNNYKNLLDLHKQAS